MKDIKIGNTVTLCGDLKAIGIMEDKYQGAKATVIHEYESNTFDVVCEDGMVWNVKSENMFKHYSIVRKRWIVMKDNRTMIWCGLARNYYWKYVESLGDTPIKYYRSKEKARASYSGTNFDGIEFVPVIETVTIAG